MIYDIIYNDTSKKFILSLLFEEKPGCKLQTYAFVYFILKTEIKYFLFYFGKDRNPYSGIWVFKASNKVLTLYFNPY